MNQYFYKLATAWVDNENSAVLEVTLNGPTLKFSESNIITFVAYDAEIYLDDLTVPVNTAIFVDKGQVLNIKQITKGTRGYLAFHKLLNIEIGRASCRERVKIRVERDTFQAEDGIRDRNVT